MESSERVVYQGKWLQFSEVAFKDKHGTERSWETIRRTSSGQAVTILAIVENKSSSSQIVCIRQFRPSVNNYVIELPAGLIDPEESPEAAAQRELLEETGFEGDIISVGPLVLNSPGMSSEGCYLVSLRVTHQTQAKLERDEDIETILIPVDTMQNHLLKLESCNNRIDAKLWSLNVGLKMNKMI
ncbi:MAG: NUDIX hydrolase [Verrucomicrobiota bacterium]